MSEADDRLDFCKQALGEIGTRSTITALDPPDGSPEAFYCNLFYQSTLEQLLRAAHWNFAARTEQLVLWKAAPGTPENTTIPTSLWNNAYPAPPWLYSYNFPTGSPIQIRRVRGQTQPLLGGFGDVPIYSGVGGSPRSVLACLPFETASDRFDDTGAVLPGPQLVILTDAQNAIADYTSKDVLVAEYDASFSGGFMAALGGKLVLALIGDKGLYQAKLQEANAQIIDARVRDGNEGLTQYDHVPDWLQVRGVSSMTPGQQWFNPPYGPLFAV